MFKDSADAVMAAKLAAGASSTEAAKAAGVSRTTAWRKLAEPSFREKVAEARGIIAAGVLSRCVELANKALDTVEELLQTDQPPNVRLGAAKCILSTASEFGERAELSERLAALEAVLGVRPKVTP